MRLRTRGDIAPQAKACPSAASRNRSSRLLQPSRGGRVSFGWRDEKWSGLDDSDFVVIAAPTAFHSDDHMVSRSD
jgi:hypothetical protein